MLPVVIITLVPFPNAVVIVVLLTVALSPVGVKVSGFPPLNAPLDVELVIVTFRGSNSQAPEAPLNAFTETLPKA